MRAVIRVRVKLRILTRASGLGVIFLRSRLRGRGKVRSADGIRVRG